MKFSDNEMQIPGKDNKIPRSEMPQASQEARFEKIKAALSGTGVEVRKVVAQVWQLQPTQWDADKKKVQSMIDNPSDAVVFVDIDGRIVDGHHRWLASCYRGDKDIEVWQASCTFPQIMATIETVSKKKNESFLKRLRALVEEDLPQTDPEFQKAPGANPIPELTDQDFDRLQKAQLDAFKQKLAKTRAARQAAAGAPPAQAQPPQGPESTSSPVPGADDLAPDLDRGWYRPLPKPDKL